MSTLVPQDQASGLRRVVTGPVGKRRLRVVAVTSGKGGVGKTNVAANLAVLAARRQHRVLVIDADLGLANVEIVLGLAPKFHIGHLLTEDVQLDQVLAQGPRGVRVLPAGSGIQSLSRLEPEQRLALVSALDTLEEAFDLIIIDTGAGIGDNVLFFAGAAQEVVLVVSPEPTSLTDAYAALKVLSQEAGVRHFRVMVNSVASEALARDVFQRLTAVSDRFLEAQVTFLGHIPRDENLGRALMARRPVVELFPRSPASRALEQLTEALLGAPPPEGVDGGLKFLWNRLLRESSGGRSA